MIFGMPTLIEYSSLEKNLALCDRVGLSFVELNMNMPCCQLSAIADHDRLRQLSAQYGCSYTIHLDENLDPFCFNPLVAQAWTQTALAAADTALALDMPVINMHMDKGIYITLPDKKVFLYDRHRDLYLGAVENFRRTMAEKLCGSNVMVCIENTSGFTGFQQDAIGLLLEDEHFALTWDIGHSFTTGEKDLPFIFSHADRLRHMHLHDASETNCHLALGDGDIPLDERLSLAGERGCRCVLETKTSLALNDSVEYLRQNGWL